MAAIVAYLGGSAAAEQATDAIMGRVRQIELFPGSGRRVPEYGLAEIREVIERPYRIIYEVFDDRVDILAIRHGRENLDPSEEA